MSSTTALIGTTPYTHGGDVQARPASVATSRSRSRFGYVLLTIAAAFGGLELLTRMWLFPASKDFARFASYPAHAEKLIEQPGLRIALIGNSATQRGVNLREFNTHMAATVNSPTYSDLFAADASKINTWYYMLNQYFWKENRQPDLFVVTFYENNLIDGNRLEIGRLAQFFTSRDDWREVFQQEVTSPAEQAEFLLCSYWSTLAARDRIKQRLLKAVVPELEEYTQAINAVGHEQATQKKTEQPVTHSTLERLLAHTKRDGTRFVFVAFPTLDCRTGTPYPLRAETTAIIEQAGMNVIDLRNLPELTEDLYDDKLHLTEAGQLVYSRILAEHLAALVGER